MRLYGKLQPVDEMPVMTSEDIGLAFKKMAPEEDISRFEHFPELDFGYNTPDSGRLRVNVSKQRGTISLAIRLVPSGVPSVDQLGLPKVCKELVLRPRGLVVVSGPTGSGKSTTLAAMINYLNQVTRRRVVTVEDPVEYIFTDDKCAITQRELGSDTLSFADALKFMLRQDPDVVMVGEMRDPETAAAVLTMAETGHLVLTTGHATSAPQAVERMINLFPPHERMPAQSRLASLLVAILCQVLVPKTDGSGRAPAVEVMLASSAVRSTIRDGKIYQLPNAMITQARLGMVLLDNALITLHRSGAINRENLFAYCNDRAEVARRIGEPEDEKDE
jgi:twitching motility protein PilT